VISLRSESLKILDVADLLEQKIRNHGKTSVSQRIKNKFKDYEGEDLIASIEKELSKL
jgi:hypothetical protein